MTPEEKKARRNELQRARRASPEAKAKEAEASRKSRAKKTTARAEPKPCTCEECVQPPGFVPEPKWLKRTVTMLRYVD